VLENELEEERAKIADLQSYVDDLLDQLADFEEVAANKFEILQLRTSLQEERSRSAFLNSKIRTLEKSLGESDSEIISLKNEVKNLSEENARKKVEVSTVEKNT